MQSATVFNDVPARLTEALRPAVTAGPERLSRAARAEIATLAGARPTRFLFELSVNWLVVVAVIAGGVYFDNPFMTALCVVIVATRQMVFALLLHEQVHRLGLRTKYGDWIVNIFAVYPLLATTIEDYAKVHLAHHKYFMTPRDPDFLRKSGLDWTFPASLKTLARIVLRDITGLNTVQLIRGKTARSEASEFARRLPSPRWLRIGFAICAAVALTAVHGWGVFLLYWLLPLLTITQLLVRWIAVVEHKYNVENAKVFEVTPLIQLKWWQKVLVPDLNFAMHAYHHFHPGVSFSNLPKVHAIYMHEGLVDESALFDGQGAFLRYLVSRHEAEHPGGK
jgi:fatty acid desaturase